MIFFQTNPQHRAVPQGHVLTSEEFVHQIKVKEERAEKDLKVKEEKKRNKEEGEASNKNRGMVKKVKVFFSLQKIGNHTKEVASVSKCNIMTDHKFL